MDIYYGKRYRQNLWEQTHMKHCSYKILEKRCPLENPGQARVVRREYCDGTGLFIIGDYKYQCPSFIPIIHGEDGRLVEGEDE